MQITEVIAGNFYHIYVKGEIEKSNVILMEKENSKFVEKETVF